MPFLFQVDTFHRQSVNPVRSQDGSVEGEGVLARLGKPGFKTQLYFLTETHWASGLTT